VAGRLFFVGSDKDKRAQTRFNTIDGVFATIRDVARTVFGGVAKSLQSLGDQGRRPHVFNTRSPVPAQAPPIFPVGADKNV
jgi:hypothetical protein